MADRVSTNILKWKTDKQSATETENIAKRIQSTLTDVSEETAQQTAELINKYRALAQVEGDVEKQTRALNTEIKKLGGADSLIKVATQEFDDMTMSIRRAEAESERLQDNFDRISQRVSFAGDVQSNLGAVSGLAGSLGGASGQRLGQGVAIAGEVAVLTEELPRLKAALQGMPSAVGTLVSSLGPVGLGLGAVLVAVGGAALLAAQQAKKQEEATYRLLDAQREATEFARTATTEDVEAQIADLRSQRDLVHSLREDIERQREQAQNRLAADESVVDFLGNLELFSGPIGTVGDLNDRMRELDAESRTLTSQIQQLLLTLNDETIAANDARVASELLAEAEAELARIRTQELLASAREQAQALQDSIDLNALDVEGLRRRNEELFNSSAVLGAELLALQQSGDTSEEVTNRINELTDALMRNGEMSNRITGTLLPLAEQQERLAQAEEERLAVEQNLVTSTENYNATVERLYEQRAEIEARYHDNLIKIAETAVKASEDALQKLQDKQRDLTSQFAQGNADANAELQRTELESQIDVQRQERDQLRDHLRKLQDIRARAEEAEFEAILNRDFRQLFSIRRGTTRDLNTANTQFTDQRNDQITALQDQRQDRLRAFEQERIDRFNAYQQQNALAFMQYQQELKAIEDRRRVSEVEARKSLVAEQQAIQAQLKLEHQAWTAQLQLAQQGTQAMVKIEQQRQQALLMQAQAGLKALQGQAIAMLGSQAGFNFSGMQNVVNNKNSQTSVQNNFHGLTDSQLTNKIVTVTSRLLGA